MDLSDYAVALKRFFLFIASGGLDQQIAFTDFHPRSELPGSRERPDPGPQTGQLRQQRG